MACQVGVLLGLLGAAGLGATFPLPIWFVLLGGVMVGLASLQRPVRPRASDFLTLTGFMLSVAAAALVLAAQFPR